MTPDEASLEDIMSEIGRRLDCYTTLVDALKVARRQIVTLGGGHETGDDIQRAVLGEIDAALTRIGEQP